MPDNIWTLLKNGKAAKKLRWFNRHRFELNVDYQPLLESIHLSNVQQVWIVI